MSENFRRSIFLCSLPALILSAACLLPYLNKAFTIDDPWYLLQAQQIRKAPLHPMAMSICWVDNVCGSIAQNMPGNFLMSYCLVPVANLANPEWIVHLMQIVVLWCGIAATVSLAFRFGFGTFAACAAGLIVAATPPVLAMASTAMPEMLTMSLGVIGIERLVAWKEDGKVFNGVVSALALGLAPIARLHLVLLWPIAAVLLRDDGRIFDVWGWIALPKRRWIPLIAAVFVSVAALVLTREPGSALKPHHMYLIPLKAFYNLGSYLTYWILAMPLGLAWLVLRNRRVRISSVSIGLGLLLVLWRVFVQRGPVFWTTLFVGVGAVVLIDVLVWSFQSRDQWRIACALWLLIPLVALPYTHLPVKYLVPCAPATALLIADLLPAFRWRMAALCGVVAAGAIFGSMVLRADAQFAEMGREATARLIAPRVFAGQRVWVSSQWGLYWYAQKAGAQVLRTDDVPAPGDYLVRGKMEGYSGTLERLPPAVQIETFTVGGPSGRTMSAKDGAGLYSNFFGDLMWVWGTGEWNHYELWRFL